MGGGTEGRQTSTSSYVSFSLPHLCQAGDHGYRNTGDNGFTSAHSDVSRSKRFNVTGARAFLNLRTSHNHRRSPHNTAKQYTHGSLEDYLTTKNGSLRQWSMEYLNQFQLIGPQIVPQTSSASLRWGFDWECNQQAYQLSTSSVATSDFKPTNALSKKLKRPPLGLAKVTVLSACLTSLTRHATSNKVSPFNCQLGVYFENLGPANLVFSKWSLGVGSKQHTSAAQTTGLPRGAVNIVGNEANASFGVLDSDYAKWTSHTKSVQERLPNTSAFSIAQVLMVASKGAGSRSYIRF